MKRARFELRMEVSPEVLADNPKVIAAVVEASFAEQAAYLVGPRGGRYVAESPVAMRTPETDFLSGVVVYRGYVIARYVRPQNERSNAAPTADHD